MAVKWTKEQEHSGQRSSRLRQNSRAGSANPWKGNGPGASGGH